MLPEMANPNLKSDCRCGQYAWKYYWFKTLDKKAQVLSDSLVLLGAFEYFFGIFGQYRKTDNISARIARTGCDRTVRTRGCAASKR